MYYNFTNSLLYSTVRIECQEGNSTSTGTGFFYKFHFEDTVVPVIVTNKHVVEGYSKGKLIFNIGDKNANKPEGQKAVNLDDFNMNWILHPEEDVDLCIFPFSYLANQLLKDEGLEIFFRAIDKNFIPSSEMIETLIPREDILVVGYPNGIWDEFNNLPILRDGITATHYMYDYNGHKKFLIDASIFPGSSGSPVYIYNQNFIDNKGNTSIGTERLLFIGIVYAVYNHTASGKIEIQSPTNQGLSVSTRVPINLGLVIKSEKMLDFEPKLKELLS
ncbi:serine protease [Bacillus sp. JNUCC-24]|uniref:S1 family peptidase n=1 Tax=Bacillus sp. JNUCC-24 TaxID=2842458 RepID=UPI001C0C7EB1|nr:serine protease [Bacillus sp. JNUCC-24]QWS49414.1 serine protease [Bacillus sp. JNUCC-24]